jgi:hypothetical protein
MAESSGQVPPWLVSGIVCLLLSSAVTVAVMLVLGYKQGETVYDIMAEARAVKGKGGGSGGAQEGRGPINGGGDKGGPPSEMLKGVGQALSGPRPTAKIVTLVEKLDALTVEPGKLELTKDQRAKVVEALGKLSEPEFLGDIPARDQMKAMLNVLKDQRAALEAAGFQWPPEESPEAQQAGAYMGNAAPVKNPFKEGDAAKRLQALQDRLGKAT